MPRQNTADAGTTKLSPLGCDSSVLKVVRAELKLGSEQEFKRMTFSIDFLPKHPG